MDREHVIEPGVLRSKRSDSYVGALDPADLPTLMATVENDAAERDMTELGFTNPDDQLDRTGSRPCVRLQGRSVVRVHPQECGSDAA